MRFNFGKLYALLLAAIVLVMMMAGFSYANESKDYHIDTVWWEETSSGNLNARWEKPENTTKYMVHLYKGTSMKSIGAWKSCVATGYNFSRDIVNNGTGLYYFEVYPVKLGKDYAVKSDALEVDYYMLKAIKNNSTPKKQTSTAQKSNIEPALAPLGPGASKNETGADRWLKVGESDWVRQKADGSLYKDQWMDIDGQRYWFDSKGYMQKNGWRSTGKYWYYLGADGAMLRDTTTPDGFVLNSEGQCVIDGTVYQSYLGPYLTNNTKGDPNKASLIPISLISVSASEMQQETGKPLNINISTSRNIEIVGEEYSLPYESWTVGQSISITVKLAPRTGYYLKKGLKISTSSNLTIVSSSGNEELYTLKFRYIPKVNLSVPGGFYITADGVLHWNAVKYAKKYQVKVSGEDGLSDRFDTSKPQYDMSEYLDNAVTVTVTACGNTNSGYIRNSKPFIIEDLDVFAEENTVEGTLSRSGDKIIYRNQDGEKVTGWEKIQGCWYHFTKGRSDGPGWYMDKTDGNWYYFDEEFRMVTGKITDDNKEYILNDGTYEALPLGALVQ